MQQSDLLSWQAPDQYPHAPAYRDVDTSKNAAEAMTKSASVIRLKVLTAIAEKNDEGATSMELSKILNIAYEAVQPRTSELKKQGKIMDSGLRRASRAEDKKSIVWIATA